MRPEGRKITNGDVPLEQCIASEQGRTRARQTLEKYRKWHCL